MVKMNWSLLEGKRQETCEVRHFVRRRQGCPWRKDLWEARDTPFDKPKVIQQIREDIHIHIHPQKPSGHLKLLIPIQLDQHQSSPGGLRREGVPYLSTERQIWFILLSQQTVFLKSTSCICWECLKCTRRMHTHRSQRPLPRGFS